MFGVVKCGCCKEPITHPKYGSANIVYIVGREYETSNINEYSTAMAWKILNREKLIEIRKTMPKCELPIDVYLYCTNTPKYHHYMT